MDISYCNTENYVPLFHDQCSSRDSMQQQVSGVDKNSDKRTIGDQEIMIDTACLNSGARCSRIECRTIPIADIFYQCLIYRHDCKFAASFGASCLCTSAHRLEYSI